MESQCLLKQEIFRKITPLNASLKPLTSDLVIDKSLINITHALVSTQGQQLTNDKSLVNNAQTCTRTQA